MKRIFLLTTIATTLAGCGGSSSDAPVSPGDQSGVTPPHADPDSSTLLTDVSTLGYRSVSQDPADVHVLSVPAHAGVNHKWQEQTNMSDDFQYTFNATSERTDFGEGRWYNFYHSNWDGPGSTYWQHDHFTVNDGHAQFRVSRSDRTDKQNKPGVNAACISSNEQVEFPVFVEASVSMSDISLAAAVWLLSPDDTQEIDILEAYAGKSNGNTYFSKYIHLSHHSFIRQPFTDYQPRDKNSWWQGSTDGHHMNGNESWGEYTWNNGDRQFIQIGVNWVNPYHFEYYINGELVRVLYNNAFATKMYSGSAPTWYYSYPKLDSNNELENDNTGHQGVETHREDTGDFNFDYLKQASELSPASVIDPYNYQKGKGFYKPMDIIINNEFQSWWEHDPTDTELSDTSGKNVMLVDWVRVFKPVAQ
ncbi:hypothetical protein BCU68_10600 [Vibrio sp. 10N.286.49.B3]|uniref:beta-agarase n=1 Tax=Vibrio sp. 10N.286.49.B3 TaxID=1880855 RepID=UPI000C829264|nr:beta-agarase [Vibrio sp. 10N.286.49.B3]PMH45313.1 hypothetical protein BCU68_10600 [Vibrio sp. 10N.286.49.B3]